MPARPLHSFLILTGCILVLGSTAVAGQPFEISAPLPGQTAQPSGASSSPHSSVLGNLFAGIGASFRLTTSTQTHHLTATHAKDLWREIDDQHTVQVKTAAALLPGMLTGEGEVSYREADGNTFKGLGEPQDQMVRMAITGTGSMIRYGLSYRSAGKNYAKDADQTARDLWAEWKMGLATVKASVKESWNNVAHDPSQPRLRQLQENVALTLAQSAWPALALSYGRTAAASAMEPEGGAATRTGSDTVDASLSYMAPTWTAKLASTYSHNRTQLPTMSETEQIHYGISGSYRPLTGLSLDPSLTLKEEVYRSVGTRTESPTAALSMKYQATAALTWTAGGSYGISHSSDGLINTRSFSAKNAVTWKALPHSMLRTAFSLETGFQRTTDRANADRATSDLSALFRLQIAGF